MSDIDIQVIDENNINDVYDDVLDQYISMFCEKYNIDNMSLESQNRWYACLEYIYNNYFKYNTSMFKYNPNINNKYNISALIQLFYKYRYYCNLYSKEINIIGYCLLTGINQTSFCLWGNDPTCDGFELYKIVMQENENSNSALLENKYKFMGAAMRLNRIHRWDAPNIKNESIKGEQIQISAARQQFESFQIEQKQE